MFFSSHLLDEVERIADRVAMIANGEVVLSDPLDVIKQAHHRLLVRFEAAQVRAPTLEGALSVHGANHEWSVVCNGELDALQKAISELNATVLEKATPTLEEIFVARASRTALGSAQEGT